MFNPQTITLMLALMFTWLTVNKTISAITIGEKVSSFVFWNRQLFALCMCFFWTLFYHLT